MTYPIQDEKSQKTKAEDDMISLFTSSSSWEEFCLKATAKYGIDVSGMFNKWHIAYCIINHGDTGWFQFFAFFIAIALAVVVPTTFAYLILLIGCNQVIVAIAAVAMAISIIVYAVVNIVRFGEFTDKLQNIQYFY